MAVIIALKDMSDRKSKPVSSVPAGEFQLLFFFLKLHTGFLLHQSFGPFHVGELVFFFYESFVVEERSFKLFLVVVVGA